MALSASDLQGRINALQQARDAGVLQVRHGNDQTIFRSLAEMDATLARLKAQLDSVNGTTPRSRVNYLRQDSKGFGHIDGNPFKDWT